MEPSNPPTYYTQMMMMMISSLPAVQSAPTVLRSE